MFVTNLMETHHSLVSPSPCYLGEPLTSEDAEYAVESYHQTACYEDLRSKLHSTPRHTLVATPKLPSPVIIKNTQHISYFVY